MTSNAYRYFSPLAGNDTEYLFDNIAHDFEYLNLLSHVKTNGRHKSDRTGTGTTSTFGYMMRFDIRNGSIPLLTSKKMYLPAIIHEIIWYLSGDSNIKYLQENGVRIWNEWADANGDLGPVYGYQWRNWTKFEIVESDAEYNAATGETFHGRATVVETKIDQIKNLLHDLANNPDSRRLMVSAWNVADLPDMKLPPCHFTFQFYTEEMTHEERIEWWQHKNQTTAIPKSMSQQLTAMGVPTRFLSCLMSQRSADVFLGVPFNIAQYSILTHIFAKLTNTAPKDFIWSGGDCHIYDNLKDQVDEQLTRVPFASPRLVIKDSVDNIDNLKYNDFEIVDYQFHPAIKGIVAI